MSNKTEKIGVGAATIIGINAMIGAGIFAMPARLATAVGPISLVSYLLSGAIVLSIVFALGRLAELHPGEGWGYKYPALWGGHGLGMFASLSYVFGVIVAMGFLVQQLGVWLTQYFPGHPLVIGIVLLALVGALVLAGAQVSAWGQYVIVAGVLVPLITVSLVCWKHVNPALMTPIAPFGYGAIFSALPSIIFTMLGFESIASLYRIVENPKKNVPRAALYSVSIVVMAFMVFVAGALFALDRAQFARGLDQAVADVLVAALPSYAWVRWVATIGATFAIIGTLHSMIWSIGELFYDSVRKAGLQVSERASIIMVVVITSFSALFLQAGEILEVTPLLIVPTYALAVAALFREPKTRDRMLGGVALVSALFLCAISAKSTLALFMS